MGLTANPHLRKTNVSGGFIMALKDIYTNAIQNVIEGTLKKEELWEVFEEHLKIEKDRNEELVQKCAEYEKRYKHLLEQVNTAHKEHEKLFGKNYS